MDVKIIDLSQSDRKPIMLEETRFICIGRDLFEKTNGMFGRVKKFFNKHQHIEKVVSLDIENVVIDPKLVVNDPKNLFTIYHDVNKTMQSEFPLNINLSRLKEPFFLVFNTKEIVDCNTQQEKTPQVFNIEYSLVLKDENGEVINNDGNSKETLSIQFKDEVNVPKVKIFLDNADIQYKSNSGLQKIGTLKVILPNTLQYAPSVDLTIDLHIEDSSGNIVNDFLTIRKDDKKYDSINETSLRAKKLANGNPTAVVGYNLYVDLDKIVNPLEDIASYTIKGDAKFKYSYDNTFQPFKELIEVICIKKDKQGTELVVSALCDGEPLAKQNNNWSVPKMEFTASELVYPIKFVIGNKATDSSRPNAGLIISNFRIHSDIREGYTLLNKSQELISVGRVVTMRGHEPEIETPQGFFIANGGAETTFNISFAPSQIYSIRYNGSKVYEFYITTKIEFDYIEDRLGDRNADVKHFSGFLEWNLFKKPNPEWLSVDFGSSAIVCFYGKGSQSDIINLRLARQKVYEDAKRAPHNKNGFENNEVKDSIEQDTLFLSSDILFNEANIKDSDTTSLCSQINYDENVKYNTMAVLLSPTEKLSANNFRRQLPCLKVLMGNQYLPDNDHYKKFKYNFVENGEVMSKTADELRDHSCSLLNIENIFKETYYTLFHFFIQDGTILEQANRVVLTYPNTYTPRNLMTMRNIVTQTLPAVRDVKFVSESDAVATYYMSHWVEYHDQNADIHKDENILVYDMGAGTLDVTFLAKRYNPTTGKFVLTINGKIGTGRAGNYLDYVIAKILYNKLREDNFKRSWISTDMRAVESDVLEARVELKSLIKTVIKPALSKTTKITFMIGTKSFSIMPNDILNDQLFVEFLDDVTTNIWENLRKYVGNNEFKIDTIILSGRSLRLNQLQERISEFAQQNNAQSIMLDNVISGENAGKSTDRSKTAVVEGAKTYVETYMTEDTPVIIKSPRLQASYGVAFKRTGGSWEYREILSRKEMPFSDENRGEFSRPGGPIIINGTNESDVIKFVQTYMSEADTQKALNEKKGEFITIMSEIMMSDFDNKASLRMDVLVDRNNNVSLYVDGRETQYKVPAGVDLADEITTHSLWPVSIVNE